MRSSAADAAGNTCSLRIICCTRARHGYPLFLTFYTRKSAYDISSVLDCVSEKFIFVENILHLVIERITGTNGV